VLDTQQGTGTFISDRKMKQDGPERERQLDQIVNDFVARAGAGGFTVKELLDRLREWLPEPEKRTK
jgi:GntR family transcriptional regulator